LFLKVSTKGRYGLLLMVDLGVSGQEGPVSLKSVAERKGLSDHYLEQLIAPLRNAGLVRSVRGAYGGYTLARPADQISAGEVLRILEGPISLVEDSGDGLEAFWNELRTSIEQVLDSTSVADLIDMWGKQEHGTIMFYI